MVESGIARERRYVRNIYALMSLFILIDPLLNSLIFYTSIIRFLELTVFCFILYFEYGFLKRFGACHYRRWVSFWIIILVLNALSIVLRGKFEGIKEMVLMLISPLGVLPYMLPFLILCLPNAEYFKTILNVFFYSCLASFPLWIIGYIDDGLVRDAYYGELIGAYFPFFAAFLLGFIDSFKWKKRLAIVCVFLIYLILMILNARRNVVLSLLLYAFFAFCSYVIKYARKGSRKLIRIFTITAVLCIAAVASFPRLTSGLLSKLLERGLENTRSRVELSFIDDFASSPASDAVFGRGMNGTYFYYFRDDVTGDLETDRNVIETGYLDMVLKGGIIQVVAVMVLLVTAIVSAFKIKGRPARFLGLVLVIYIISLYTSAPISSFCVPAIIFWVCVSTSIQLGGFQKRKRESGHIS